MKFKFSILLFFILLTLNSQSQLQLDNFILRSKYDIINNDFIAAIEKLNKVIKVEADNFEAYYLRGIARFNLGDYIGADHDFSTSTNINPFFANSLHYLAITKNKIYEYDEALKYFDKALEYDPFNPEIFLNRGISNSMVQNYNEAIEDFDRAIKLNSKYAIAYLARGTVKAIMQRYEEALKDLDQSIRLNPFNAEAYNKRGWVKYEEEKFNEAIEDFNQTIKLNKDEPVYYFARALCKYQNSDFVAALEDFNQVLQLDPDNALTLYNRALLYSETGAYNDAIKDYEKVTRLNPKNILTYFNMAGTKLQIEDFKGAINDYSKAIEIYPDFASAYINRAFAKKKSGDEKGANADNLKAKEIIERYQSKINDSEGIDFADTSKNFKELIALNSDFENKTQEYAFKTGAIQNIEVDIQLKPNYNIFVIEILAEKPVYKNYVKSIENFNEDFTIEIITLPSSETNIDSVFNIDVAISLIDSLIVQKYQPAKSYAIKSLYNFYIQNFNKSLYDITKSIEIDKSNELYYFLRANINDAKIDFINSFDHMNISLSLNTIPIDDQEGTSSFEEINDILNDYTRAIELAPDFSHAYYNRANVKCKNRDFWGAIQDYTKSIELNQELGEAYYNRGLTQIYLQDNKKACYDLSSAGQLGIMEAYNIMKRYCKEESEIKPDVKIEE